MSGPDKLRNYFNQPWLDFTGRSFDQQRGQSWAEDLHPDDRERCLTTYRAAFDGRRDFEMEFRLKRHDGVYRAMLDRGRPRFTAEGIFLGYVGSCLDITERKLAEEDLREKNRRKDEFLAMLSHELRNPLASILNALQILRLHEMPARSHLGARCD